MRYNLLRRTVLTFLALIAVGTVLLLIPACASDGRGLGWTEALFTATSAVCVTGLTVVDTEHGFSPLGQLVILGLIQAGGLGILTLSNFFLLALRSEPMPLEGRLFVEETHGLSARLQPSRLLRRIFFFTVACESIGTLLLFVRFSRDASVGRAFWLAVFHAVSAFCNAGFSLFSESLSVYRDDLVVNGTIAGLVVMGGLGFFVLSDFSHVARASAQRGSDRLVVIWTRLSYHTKVTLAYTGALLVIGTVVFLFLESFNTLSELPLYRRILPAAFLSVTSRTAGFNTLPTGELTNISLLLLMVLMVIGASPGSTGGGTKTTTFAIALAAVTSRIRNRPRAELMGRSVPEDLVAKAVATLGLFASLLLAAVLALECAEYGFAAHSVVPGRLLDFFFEVTSALGTVGLSTGITPTLKPISQLVLVGCMFIGRVGPLVVAGSLIGQRRRLRYTLPKDSIMVG